MKRIGLHILFWGAILYWRASGDAFAAVPFEKFVLHNLLRLPIMIIATYLVIYYLLPKFIIQEKKYLLFGVLFSLNFGIASYIDQLIIESDWMKTMLQLAHEKQHKYIRQLHPFRNSFRLISIMGLASLTRFFKLYLAQEKKEHQLVQEHLETQYAFLKAQINPHFLFNALNNIYSMAVQNEQTDIALGLENLSGIMHYLTYESNAKQVPLKKEIDLLKNYMDIEHLRIADTDDTTISFNVEGALTHKVIAPVILLPLVENAFKHGVKIDEKCLVSIKLIVAENTLTFTIRNTLFDFEAKEVKEKGVGLENVKKRLALRYPDRYSLKTEVLKEYFYTELIIDLEEKTTISLER